MDSAKGWARWRASWRRGYAKMINENSWLGHVAETSTGDDIGRLLPSMICRCFVMMSSVIRCCRCILCNRSPLRRNSYDSTNRSPCSAILSASNSCTRHINDRSSRSVSESRRFGRFCEQHRPFHKKPCPNIPRTPLIFITFSKATACCRTVSSSLTVLDLSATYRSCSCSM